MSFFKKLFGIKTKAEEKSVTEFTQDQYETDYELKQQGLEKLLGEMHGLVGHAIIPFAVGGAVDMYYFTKHINGTGFATMELLDPEGNGPLRNRLGTYELVAFTKEPYSGETYDVNSSTTETSSEIEENLNAFNLIERRFCGIFTTIANYSTQAVLNPLDTCEVPVNENEYRCLVFDIYQPDDIYFSVGERKHHLLLCLEVFRSEMEYARKNGSQALLDLLKQQGYYPYSDLNRESVI